MKRKNIVSPNGETWDEYKRNNLSPLEIELLRIKSELMEPFITKKKTEGLTQKELEKMSGVSQPVISRLINRTVDSNISTILKVLIPLGYTIEVVKLKKTR